MTQEWLQKAVKTDPFYQRLLGECMELETEVLRIRHSLSPSDQEKLDRYIALCEKKEYRRTTLLLELFGE